EAERQALALMDHPNIARIFDAGTTDSGRPFFVMELVRGTRITEYCDHHQLTTSQRLDLFIRVCNAIQHAHQKGIIHRDIKPSNILVTLHDGVPVPKVIDFGIAKATQQELTDKTVFTQFQQFIGTPAYISPEQAEMSGLDIDTRADIYSLGVLLYELLVGQTPFSAKEMMEGGLDSLRKIIREREPQRPSTKLNTLAGDARTTAGKRRRTEVGQLAHQLQGDLDWIVMKCLEKDRTRRYDTANGLAMDIQRYLASEPVTARPPSTSYRIQRLVRRNKMAFAAGSLVGLTLFGLMVSILVFSIVYARQQQRTSDTLRASLAGEYLRRGQNLCLSGKVTEGLHWLGRSLEQAPADQTNLSATIRRNLGGWSAVRNRPLAVIHQDALVYAAAFSPTEDRVVLGGMENSAQLYSATTGEPVGPPMPHLKTVRQAVFSPDGKFLASTDDERAMLWFASDSRPVFPEFGPPKGVESVAFSPDSRRLVTAMDYGFAQQWSVETGETFGPPLTHATSVASAVFSPDGRWIATGSADETARIWSAETGTPASQPLVHQGAVTRVAFSPDGKLLATLSRDRTVRRWAVPGGELVTPPIRHTDEVNALEFSPDGQQLVTADEAGIARIWNLQGEPMGSPMRNEGGVLAVAFTPDGRRLVTGGRDRTARFWSATTGEPLGQPMEHDGWVAEIHFNRDGTKVLTRTYGHSGIVWAAHPASASETQLQEQPLLTGVISPDGRRLLTGNILGEARVWSAETAEPTGLVVKHRLWSVAFSPDGQHFLTAGEGVRFWSTTTGEPYGAPLPNGTHMIRAATFSPDGNWVATAGFDKTARLWSMATRQQIGEPLLHPKLLEDVAFSPDGTRLLTAGSDGRALVWSLATRDLALPPLEHRSAVLGASFSPDGRRILTCGRDATAQLWDATTGQPVGSPLTHPDWVEQAAFSPDGTLIVTGSGDGRAWFWSALDGQLLGPPMFTHGPIMDVRFSPNGEQVLVSSQARQFWRAQGPTFRGATLWRIPQPFTGPVSTVEHWIETQTGMTLDERGVLSRLDGRPRSAVGTGSVTPSPTKAP
ncbi:MAG: protein kinase, partial [Verrucomicrobiales bacterium]|nr:protein kinase [Verrucomicrobiales bacterium]